MMILRKKVFIFDMDGVLIDSNRIKARSFSIALRSFGVSVSEEEIMKYMGMSRWDIARVLINEYGLKVDVNDLVEIRMKILDELRAYINPFPCARGLLNLLRSLGKKLILATSSDRESTFKELGKLANLFDRIVTSDDVKKTKPDPELYIKASSGFDRSLCVVIEDSPYGIIAAKRAGIDVIAVMNGYRNRSVLVKSGADLVLDDICSLYQILLKEVHECDSNI